MASKNKSVGRSSLLKKRYCKDTDGQAGHQIAGFFQGLIERLAGLGKSRSSAAQNSRFARGPQVFSGYPDAALADYRDRLGRLPSERDRIF